VAAAALALTLVSIALPSASAAPVDGWTGTFGDAGNAMNNPGETTITAANAARLKPAWVSSVPGGTVYAPPASRGVAYRIVDEQGVGSFLAATSVRTGATLWTLHGLPYHLYWDALAVTGHYVIVAYDGWGATDSGGLLLIDTTTHKLVWSRPLPPATISWMGNGTAGVPYTDGTRIYVSGSGNRINTYRLSDGALLWTLPITNNNQGTPARFDGIAVANGNVYSVGEEGLVARDAATGRRLWRAPGVWGVPVVAGNHVYGTTFPRVGHTAVVALPTGGCGHTTCSPLWQVDIGADLEYPAVRGADPSTLFITYRKAGLAFVSRMAASTGKVQWTTSTGTYIGDLVRGSSTIWMFEQYTDASGAEAYRIVGFSATATAHTPLRTILMTDRTYSGFPQHLSIVDGSLLQKLNGWTLAAYRIPGT
jgi:outer membrane protein assembly factor BamB